LGGFHGSRAAGEVKSDFASVFLLAIDVLRDVLCDVARCAALARVNALTGEPMLDRACLSRGVSQCVCACNAYKPCAVVIPVGNEPTSLEPAHLVSGRE
jgi:hypothetical protein